MAGESFVREDLHIPMLQPTCGCTFGRDAVCKEGKRLEALVTARYRNCFGLYNKRAQQQANQLWREACEELERHIRANDRD